MTAGRSFPAHIGGWGCGRDDHLTRVLHQWQDGSLVKRGFPKRVTQAHFWPPARSSLPDSPLAREASRRGYKESSPVLARFSCRSRALCLRRISGLAILARPSRVMGLARRASRGSRAFLARNRPRAWVLARFSRVLARITGLALWPRASPQSSCVRPRPFLARDG
jgi:hypothetical protein